MINTTFATSDVNGAVCTSVDGGDDVGVWYALRGTDNVFNIMITATDVSNPKIAIFTGTCDNLVCVRSIAGTSLSWEALLDTEYRILITGGAGIINFVIAISGDGTEPAPVRVTAGVQYSSAVPTTLPPHSVVPIVPVSIPLGLTFSSGVPTAPVRDPVDVPFSSVVPTAQPSSSSVAPTALPSSLVVPTALPSFSVVPTSLVSVPVGVPSSQVLPTIQPSSSVLPTIQPSSSAIPTAPVRVPVVLVPASPSLPNAPFRDPVVVPFSLNPMVAPSSPDVPSVTVTAPYIIAIPSSSPTRSPIINAASTDATFIPVPMPTSSNSRTTAPSVRSMKGMMRIGNGYDSYSYGKGMGSMMYKPAKMMDDMKYSATSTGSNTYIRNGDTNIGTIYGMKKAMNIFSFFNV